MTNSIVIDCLPAERVASPHVLFLPGFHSTRHGNKSTHLAALCARRKWGYTRFDYQGIGDSPGSAADSTLHDWLDNARQALQTTHSVRTQSADTTDPLGPMLLVGSSMGAWLAMHLACDWAASPYATVKLGVLTVAAAPDFLHTRLHAELTAEQQDALRSGQCVWLSNRYDASRWPVTAALMQSSRDLQLLEPEQHDDGHTPATSARIKRVCCPVRMLHGTADQDVPDRQSRRLLDAISSNNATLTLIRNADHRLSDPQSLSWLERELDALAALCDGDPDTSHISKEINS